MSLTKFTFVMCAAGEEMGHIFIFRAVKQSNRAKGGEAAATL